MFPQFNMKNLSFFSQFQKLVWVTLLGPSPKSIPKFDLIFFGLMYTCTFVLNLIIHARFKSSTTNLKKQRGDPTGSL